MKTSPFIKVNSALTRRKKSGQTLVEYGLILALISIVFSSLGPLLGQRIVDGVYGNAISKLSNYMEQNAPGNGSETGGDGDGDG